MQIQQDETAGTGPWQALGRVAGISRTRCELSCCPNELVFRLKSLHLKGLGGLGGGGLIGVAQFPQQLERPLEETVSQRLAKIVPNPLGEAIRSACKGGKRIRPLISLWFGAAHGVDRDSSLGVACLTEWLHNAFLIHDDIQMVTTGAGTNPHCESHGTATALNAADWLLSQVYSGDQSTVSGRLRAVEIASGGFDVHRRTVEGQQLDLGGRADSRDSSSPDYERPEPKPAVIWLRDGMRGHPADF